MEKSLFYLNVRIKVTIDEKITILLKNNVRIKVTIDGKITILLKC